MTNLIDIRRLRFLVFDFDGVFTDNSVNVDSNGVESVRCSRADGLGIDLWRRYCAERRLEVATFILSTERSEVVARRAEKLGLEFYQGVVNKKAFLLDRCLGETAYRKGNDSIIPGLCYVGNDLNDLGAMKIAEVKVCPRDSHPFVMSVADKVIDVKGGEGFVRAVIEDLLDIPEKTIGEIYNMFDR